jgi:DNA-binding CsgD family transcriptional regulator
MDIRYSEAPRFSPDIERAYERLLGALGTARIEDEFFSGVEGAVGEFDRAFCYEKRADAQPSLYCCRVPDGRSQDLIRKYRTFFHLVDPIRDVFHSVVDSGCASITLHADEIEDREYRASWERFSIRHRVSIVKNIGDLWLTLSVGRRTRPFAESEIEALDTLSRVALPLISKNEALKAKTVGGNFSVVELERRLENLGKGFTGRERQVCARTVAGISAEGAGLDLGISLASVLTYRQRGYRRVNVSNAIQLAALVMH